ncbi:MAG: cache domain-containing protein, partial [Candidatus Aminicenantes bacterium]|nr:cache domain-containing protein [Candidatus Aminicenantes bacterium]
MKFSRSKMLWTTVLTLAALCGAMPSALAQDERTTASQVDLTNPETLIKFVESARDYISSITDINQLAALAVELREEGGDWKDGNMYLVIFTPDGTVWFHGADVELDGTHARDVKDDDGADVVQKIIAAGQMEGGDFVDYTWDDPSDP